MPRIILLNLPESSIRSALPKEGFEIISSPWASGERAFQPRLRKDKNALADLLADPDNIAMIVIAAFEGAIWLAELVPESLRAKTLIIFDGHVQLNSTRDGWNIMRYQNLFTRAGCRGFIRSHLGIDVERMKGDPPKDDSVPVS